MVLLLPLLLALGSPETPAWTGRLSVVGNEPFTVLALTDANGRQWRLSGEVAKDLWDRAQGRWVRVTGSPQGSDGILVEAWVWAAEERSPR